MLVIVVDALRADHVSSFGYDRRTTPAIDGLASKGVAFTSTWSASPEMLPAHAAILTGCDPRLAQRPDLKVTGRESELASWFVPDGVPRLAQQFLAHGYETAAFVDHGSISQVHGFARGFQQFFGYREDSALPQGEYGIDVVASKFSNWLGGLPPSQNWFAYLHVDDLERVWARSEINPTWDMFFDSRAEMSQVPPVADGDDVFFAIPRRRWSGGTLSMGEYEARYDGALRQLDRSLARLLESMMRRGRLENTTVVIVGSFGLSMGESGLYLSSGTLSDADLRVPLVVRPSRRLEFEEGRRVDALVSTIDIAPTLLDLHAIPVPPGMQGVSQMAWISARGETPVARERVFASGGLQGGIAAIDASYCWEEGHPGRGWDTRAIRSWYGDEADHASDTRTFLHDRRADPRVGHLEPFVDEPPPVDPADPEAQARHAARAAERTAAAARLSEAAREWYGWIDAVRPVLHRPSSARGDVPPELLEELVRRRFLPAKP